MSDHRYPIRYKIETRVIPFTREEIGRDGGTDAVALASITYGEDGSSSTMWLSLDGWTGRPLTGTQLFVQVWGQLAAVIERDDAVQPKVRKLARETLDAMRKLIVK